MPTSDYPKGSFDALIRSPLVTDATRTALRERLAEKPEADLLNKDERATLQAVCDRLFPSENAPAEIDLAAAFEARLANGKGDGWRYNALPPDAEAQRMGLRGIDEHADQFYHSPFHDLAAADQDATLQMVQRGRAQGNTWRTLDAKRYFEELLAALTELYYSHPLVQEQIGYVGYADAAGWQKIGLDEREPWEPASEKEGAHDTYHLPNDLPPPSPRVEQPASTPPQAHDDVDVVVIGTGAGGAPVLARLAAAGLRVVALEAGPQWNPAAQWPTDEIAQAPLFWRDERLSAGSHPLAFGNNNSGTGVGGSTLHYTAYTPRAHPDDFRLFSDSGLGVDWPIGYDDLERYYDEVEHFIGVSGPAQYPWGPERRRSYPHAPLPLNGAAQLMERGCRSLGIRTSPAPNAAISAAREQPGLGHRPACTNRGFCQAGCTTGAKSSTDVTFIPLARMHSAEIRPGCFVTGFERDSNGAITAVIYTRNGNEERQRCKAVYLCGGAVETPRLLLINGLANSSGQVGRNFMAHPGMQVWAQFDEFVRPFKGIPGGLISEDNHRPADADFVGGYLLQSIGVMPVTYATQMARGRGLWGEEGQRHMAGYNHVAGINILGDCLPYDGNFLELADERDSRGLPKPRIHFSQGDNERKLTAHAEKVMRAIWEAAGAHDIWSFDRHAHIIGTCRMGSSADNAVVDADCRSFDVPNLYIVDNSVFPSALSVNPALTIMALALRSADRFLAARR